MNFTINLRDVLDIVCHLGLLQDMFHKLDLPPSSDQEERWGSYSVGPIANSPYHCTWIGQPVQFADVTPAGHVFDTRLPHCSSIGNYSPFYHGVFCLGHRQWCDTYLCNLSKEYAV
jgi:hypothetical protein